jgi:hypothetical protein
MPARAKPKLTTEPPPSFPPPDAPGMGPVPITSAPPPETGYEGFGDPVPPPIEETRRLVADTQSDDITALSEQDRHSFDTLLSCGRRSKTIEVMGHKVSIESLNVDDDLRIGMFTKDYRESDAFARAVQVATVAAGIRTINNRPIVPGALSPEATQANFQAKVDKLVTYYPIVITEIYREILNLDAEFADLALKLGKLKG